MVSVFLSVQTLLVVQGQGWFADWLSLMDIARLWLANGREGARIARAERLVWLEEQEARAERHAQDAELEAFFQSPLEFADYRANADRRFVPMLPWMYSDHHDDDHDDDDDDHWRP